MTWLGYRQRQNARRQTVSRPSHQGCWMNGNVADAAAKRAPDNAGKPPLGPGTVGNRRGWILVQGLL